MSCVYLRSRHSIALCVRCFVIRHDNNVIRFRVALARVRFAFHRAFDTFTIFRIELRTHDVVLRLRENPRRIVFVHVTHIRAQPYAHFFRRDRRVRVVVHDVVVQRFQNDCRRFTRFRVFVRNIRFRVFLRVRHFVFHFHHQSIASLRFDVFTIT